MSDEEHAIKKRKKAKKDKKKHSENGNNENKQSLLDLISEDSGPITVEVEFIPVFKTPIQFIETSLLQKIQKVTKQINAEWSEKNPFNESSQNVALFSNKCRSDGKENVVDVTEVLKSVPSKGYILSTNDLEYSEPVIVKGRSANNDTDCLYRVIKATAIGGDVYKELEQNTVECEENSMEKTNLNDSSSVENSLKVSNSILLETLANESITPDEMLKSVKNLLEQGADIHATDNKGNTAIQIALSSLYPYMSAYYKDDCYKLLETLVITGCNPHIGNNNDITPFASLLDFHNRKITTFSFILEFMDLMKLVPFEYPTDFRSHPMRLIMQYIKEYSICSDFNRFDQLLLLISNKISFISANCVFENIVFGNQSFNLDFIGYLLHNIPILKVDFNALLKYIKNSSISINLTDTLSPISTLFFVMGNTEFGKLNTSQCVLYCTYLKLILNAGTPVQQFLIKFDSMEMQQLAIKYKLPDCIYLCAAFVHPYFMKPFFNILLHEWHQHPMALILFFGNHTEIAPKITEKRIHKLYYCLYRYSNNVFKLEESLYHDISTHLHSLSSKSSEMTSIYDHFRSTYSVFKPNSTFNIPQNLSPTESNNTVLPERDGRTSNKRKLIPESSYPTGDNNINYTSERGDRTSSNRKHIPRRTGERQEYSNKGNASRSRRHS